MGPCGDGSSQVGGPNPNPNPNPITLTLTLTPTRTSAAATKMRIHKLSMTTTTEKESAFVPFTTVRWDSGSGIRPTVAVTHRVDKEDMTTWVLVGTEAHRTAVMTTYTLKKQMTTTATGEIVYAIQQRRHQPPPQARPRLRRRAIISSATMRRDCATRIWVVWHIQPVRYHVPMRV